MPLCSKMKDEHLFSTAVLTWAAAKHCCVRAAMTPPTKSKTLLLAGEVTPNVVLQLKCLGIAIILSTMGSTQGRGGLLYILQLTYYSYDVQPQRGEGGGGILIIVWECPTLLQTKIYNFPYPISDPTPKMFRL